MSGVDALRCHLSAAFSQTCFDMCLLMNRGSIFCKFNLTPIFMILNANERTFAPFSLTRLLTTCFGRGNGKSLYSYRPTEPATSKTSNSSRTNFSIQNAHEVFRGSKMDSRRDELDGRRNLCLQRNGGSNLDMEDDCFDPEGNHLSLDNDIYTAMILF